MADDLTAAQLLEVLRAEQRRRWHEGQHVPAETYLRDHPALRADDARALELVYYEVMLREELGDRPDLDEYLRRFPQFSSQLPPLFAVHRALEAPSFLGEGGMGETAPSVTTFTVESRQEQSTYTATWSTT